MKPLCDLCRTRHESHQAHVFVANAKPVANKVVANKKFHEDVEEGFKAGLKKAISRYRDPEARRAYMRILMRKRRARLPG